MNYCVYILYSEKLDLFYTGTAQDFIKRFEEHNAEKYEDSFSKRGTPWIKFLVIENLTSKAAYAIETQIKKMNEFHLY